MIFHDTDREWEEFGRRDPYFGVLSHDRYRRENLDPDGREDFFRTGATFIEHVLEKIRAHLDPAFAPASALDFGCGVGRLTIPLARVADRVTGVDVSASMLAEARKNCAALAIGNADFLPADDGLSRLTGSFDLLVSFIVFQHIPTRRGRRILRNLLDLLGSGGVGVLHFTYAKNGRGRKLAHFLKSCVPWSKYLINLGMRRRLDTPQMQMNSYDMNQVFHILQQYGVSGIHAEFSDHGGELGLILYFRKP